MAQARLKLLATDDEARIEIYCGCGRVAQEIEFGVFHCEPCGEEYTLVITETAYRIVTT